MDEIIKIVANYFIVIPVAVVIVLFIRLKRSDWKTFITFFVVAGIISLLLAIIGSYLFNDPRPFVVSHMAPLIPHGADNGFPSDHTLLSSFMGFAVLKYSKKLGIMLLLIAALIGVSRVLADVHHVPDIIGGFCFAALGTYAALLIARRFFKPKQSPNA